MYLGQEREQDRIEHNSDYPEARVNSQFSTPLSSFAKFWATVPLIAKCGESEVHNSLHSVSLLLSQRITNLLINGLPQEKSMFRIQN